MSPSTQPMHVEDIPFEIWAKIFGLCLPHIRVPHAKLSTKEVPLSVSQTCTRWRQIAIGTPRLWGSITLIANSEMPLYPHPSLVNLCLERSGTLSPLSVDIQVTRPIMTSQPDVLKCLVRIFSQIARWRIAKLWIYNTDPDLISTLQSSIMGAPLLECLELDARPNVTHDPLLPSNLWMDSPCLRKLMLALEVPQAHDSNRIFDDVDRHIQCVISHNIPFQQITHLHLDLYEIVSPHQLCHVFKYTSNLVSCFIGGHCSLYIMSNNRSPDISLQHLKYLGLQCPGNLGRAVLREVLRQIAAPSLTTICFFDIHGWDNEAYTNFITRSSCQLEELLFVKSRVTPAELILCMRLSPSLKIVHTDYLCTPLTRPIVTWLTVWDSIGSQFSLCPGLERLSFANLPIYNDSKEDHPGVLPLIIKLLKTRLRHVPKTFTTFVSHSDTYKLDDMSPDFLALQEEPLGLEIISNPTYIPDGPRTFWDIYGGSRLDS